MVASLKISTKISAENPYEIGSLLTSHFSLLTSHSSCLFPLNRGTEGILSPYCLVVFPGYGSADQVEVPPFRLERHEAGLSHHGT